MHSAFKSCRKNKCYICLTFLAPSLLCYFKFSVCKILYHLPAPAMLNTMHFAKCNKLSPACIMTRENRALRLTCSTNRLPATIATLASNFADVFHSTITTSINHCLCSIRDLSISWLQSFIHHCRSAKVTTEEIAPSVCSALFAVQNALSCSFASKKGDWLKQCLYFSQLILFWMLFSFC